MQEAVYSVLTGSAALSALVGERIYDAAPHSDAPDATAGVFVTLGDERVSNWSAQGLSGAIHDFSVTVHGSDEGFAAAKVAAEAVSAAVLGPLPPLSQGRVATADFRGARARRERAGGRAIELRFRFRIEA
ncbi:DUF3168 domain-containing protein [Albimonas sp. CAU 1670]|uniref:tail completion protein gp17 n=1 Tax=Albimonas sp. CAU 1670 TaxID=3032599 RepID=UPI0023DA50A2|nr:DUF3168 domain-containing protein [Albimonas sp. CAU 1670]MDF2232956.1 DUF3168 domain-containing protein [Albimonas sp. CAU 1670]